MERAKGAPFSSLPVIVSASVPFTEGLQKVFRDLGLSLFEAQDSGLKVRVRVRMPILTLGITGLHEILGRNYGIEELYCGASLLIFLPHVN